MAKSLSKLRTKRSQTNCFEVVFFAIVAVVDITVVVPIVFVAVHNGLVLVNGTTFVVYFVVVVIDVVDGVVIDDDVVVVVNWLFWSCLMLLITSYLVVVNKC